MLTANCPLPAALTSVPETACPIDYGQISKIIIQKIQAVSSFTAATVKLKATFTPLLIATDDTKVVISPMINDFKLPKSEILSEGGNDNTTFMGMPVIKGLGFVGVTGLFKSISDASKQAMQALFPHSQISAGVTEIWAYFLTSDNKIICKSDGSGIPIYNLAVSDPGSEGFGKLNECDLKFSLPGGWSDGVVVIPTTDIKVITFKNPA